MKAKLGPAHPYTLVCTGSLGNAYQAAGKLDKALPYYKEAMEKLKAKLGPYHPYTLTSSNNLASVYVANRDFEKALPLMEQTLEKQKAKCQGAPKTGHQWAR